MCVFLPSRLSLPPLRAELAEINQTCRQIKYRHGPDSTRHYMRREYYAWSSRDARNAQPTDGEHIQDQMRQNTFCSKKRYENSTLSSLGTV